MLALETRTLLSNWYVNSANTGPQNGLTPATGYVTIQAGIDSAAAGDTILVENGMGYNESDTVGVAGLTIEAGTGQAPVLDGDSPSFQGSAGFTITTTGVTIAGLTIQHFDGPSAVVVQSGASLTLLSDVIRDNSANNNGGGVDDQGGDVNISGGTISGNYAGSRGGGAFATSGGQMKMIGGNLSNNSAGNQGGGVFVNSGSLTIAGTTITSNSANSAGGVGINDGTATITASAIVNNSAGSSGAGLEVESVATANVTNSTFDGNTAFYGGGINNNGILNMTNCTVTGNTGYFGGGGLRAYSSAVTLTNTIVAGNSFFGGDISGNVSGSNNLIGTGGSGGLQNGVNGNLVGVFDPLLGSLGNYGGTTQTVPLLPGSPAIAAGTTAAGITMDQRGLPLGPDDIDIGAFQSQGFTLGLVPGSSPQSANIFTQFASPLAVIVTANNPAEPVDGGSIGFAVTPSAGGASASSRPRRPQSRAGRRR